MVNRSPQIGSPCPINVRLERAYADIHTLPSTEKNTYFSISPPIPIRCITSIGEICYTSRTLRSLLLWDKCSNNLWMNVKNVPTWFPTMVWPLGFCPHRYYYGMTIGMTVRKVSISIPQDTFQAVLKAYPNQPLSQAITELIKQALGLTSCETFGMTNGKTAIPPELAKNIRSIVREELEAVEQEKQKNSPDYPPRGHQDRSETSVHRFWFLWNCPWAVVHPGWNPSETSGYYQPQYEEVKDQ